MALRYQCVTWVFLRKCCRSCLIKDRCSSMYGVCLIKDRCSTMYVPVVISSCYLTCVTMVLVEFFSVVSFVCI